MTHKPSTVYSRAFATCMFALLAAAFVLPMPGAFAADQLRPMNQPGSTRMAPAAKPGANAARATDPRIAQFKRELAAYQRGVTALHRDVQRLQAQQRHLNVLAGQMKTVGDDAQMMQLQLQQAMQKQQQAMQMLSNIMKAMHDTERSIIRNMK